MVKTRRGYKKAGDLVEVVLHSSDRYESTIKKACSVLRIPIADKKMRLLRMSGSLIPNTSLPKNQVWTIGQYVKQTFSSARSPRNFGVAIIESDDVSNDIYRKTFDLQCVYI